MSKKIFSITYGQEKKLVRIMRTEILRLIALYHKKNRRKGWTNADYHRNDFMQSAWKRLVEGE